MEQQWLPVQLREHGARGWDRCCLRTRVPCHTRRNRRQWPFTVRMTAWMPAEVSHLRFKKLPSTCEATRTPPARFRAFKRIGAEESTRQDRPHGSVPSVQRAPATPEHFTDRAAWRRGRSRGRRRKLSAIALVCGVRVSVSEYSGLVPIVAFVLWWVLFPEHAARTYSDVVRRLGGFPEKRVPKCSVFRILGILALAGIAFLVVFRK